MTTKRPRHRPTHRASRVLTDVRNGDSRAGHAVPSFIDHFAGEEAQHGLLFVGRFGGGSESVGVCFAAGLSACVRPLSTDSMSRSRRAGSKRERSTAARAASIPACAVASDRAPPARASAAHFGRPSRRPGVPSSDPLSVRTPDRATSARIGWGTRRRERPIIARKLALDTHPPSGVPDERMRPIERAAKSGDRLPQHVPAATCANS